VREIGGHRCLKEDGDIEINNVTKALFRIHMFLGLPDPDPPVRSMYLQKVIRKTFFLKICFCWRLEGQ
jgi:hypothetical protein